MHRVDPPSAGACEIERALFPLFLQTCNTFPGFSTADGAASRAARDTLLGAFLPRGTAELSAPPHSCGSMVLPAALRELRTIQR